MIVTITPAGCGTLQARESSSIDRIEAVLVRLTVDERKRLAAAVPLIERIATEL